MGGIFTHGTWDMGRLYIYILYICIYIYFCLILERFFFSEKNETDKVI